MELVVSAYRTVFHGSRDYRRQTQIKDFKIAPGSLTLTPTAMPSAPPVSLAVNISTARRSNQSILKEISPGCSLEGMMLKLKLQYFGHLTRRVDSDAGRDWGQEEKGTTEDEIARWHQRLDEREFE